MNTHAEYRRHTYAPPDRPTADVEAVMSELARHHDPSLATRSSTPQSHQTRAAWIRPTDIPSYAGPMVARGIDLQAELTRRARRTPLTASRSLRRSAPTAAPPAPGRTEGLQL